MSSSSDSQSESLFPTRHPKPTLSTPHAHDAGSANDDSEDSNPSEPEDDHTLPDAPVLSHADKRRQNKKKKGNQLSDADTVLHNDSADNVTADHLTTSSAKRQNSVWVGNLAFKTTTDALRKFFNGVGEITRIHMPMKLSTRADAQDNNKRPAKENRGFAYVDFASPDSKLVAISLSENPLDGRRLLIKDGDDFNGRPAPAASSSSTSLDHGGIAGNTSNPLLHTKTAQKILRAQKQPPGPTLFLGNLGFEATEASIRDMLESHRVRVRQADEDANEDAAASDKWIRKVRMGTFEDSGKCKGWAFVDFTTAEHATAALTNPKNHHLDGRNLVVEYASPDAVRRGGFRPSTGTDKHFGSGDRSRPGQHKRKEGHTAPSRKRTYGDGDGDTRGKKAGDGADGDVDEDGDGEGEEGGDGRGDGRPAKRPKVAGGRPERKGDAKGPRTRAKPGAALAQAKREAVAIVPSQGQKIVF